MNDIQSKKVDSEGEVAEERFKLRYALFGVLLMATLVLFFPKNEHGTPQANILVSDAITWFMKGPGILIAIWAMYRMIRMFVSIWQKTTDKKEAIKTIMKFLMTVVAGVIATVFLTAVVPVWLSNR